MSNSSKSSTIYFLILASLLIEPWAAAKAAPDLSELQARHAMAEGLFSGGRSHQARGEKAVPLPAYAASAKSGEAQSLSARGLSKGAKASLAISDKIAAPKLSKGPSFLGRLKNSLSRSREGKVRLRDILIVIGAIAVTVGAVVGLALSRGGAPADTGDSDNQGGMEDIPCYHPMPGPDMPIPPKDDCGPVPLPVPPL